MDDYLLVIKGQIMMVRRKNVNIYSIKMKKSLFFKYSEKIVASSVKVLDNFVYFKTDGITKKYLDENKINYTFIGK